MIPLFRPNIVDASRKAVARCLRSTWIGYGPECHALERTFIGPHGGWALATSSCTSALHIAAALCRPEKNEEVILSPIAFVSAAMAFACAGFALRFADVDAATLMPSDREIERRISSRTRAVVATHLYGQRAPLAGLRRLCDRHRLILIEDCAHRIDLLDDGPRLADFSCFSFNAIKEAPCGEGGLLWGRAPELENAARAISNAGLEVDTWQRSGQTRHRDYAFGEWRGLKLRLNDILAALVRPALATLSQQRAKRHRLFARYDSALRSLAPAVVPLARQPDDSCLMYVVRLDGPNRERVRGGLAAGGIASSVHYPSLTEHRLLNPLKDRCPVAESVARQIVTLPSFLTLTPRDQERVAKALAKSVTSKQRGTR